MLGLDTTQIATLAEGWEYEIEDVTQAAEICDALASEGICEITLEAFVGHIDSIKMLLAENGGVVRDPRMDSASYIIYCVARLEAGLPLE